MIEINPKSNTRLNKTQFEPFWLLFWSQIQFTKLNNTEIKKQGTKLFLVQKFLSSREQFDLKNTHNRTPVTLSLSLLNQSDSLQSLWCAECRQLQGLSTRDLSEESTAVRTPPPLQCYCRSRAAKHVLWRVSAPKSLFLVPSEGS